MAEESRRARRILQGAAVLAALVFLLLVARYWHPVYGFTKFLQLDATNDDLKISEFHAQPIYVYRNTGGYDGLYYAQIAYHPGLTDPELPTAIDSLGYRARRILPPAIAWLLAGGNPAWIVHVYSILNVAAWLVLAVVLWRLLAVSDARAFLAWVGVMFSAGALASVRFALTDLLALTILAGALLAAERARPRGATALLAAAALARETSLLGLAGFVDQPWWSRRNLGRVFLVAAPLVVWCAYVRAVTPPVDPGTGNFTWPLVGFVTKWQNTLHDLGTAPARDSVPTLLVVIGLTVQAAYLLLRRRLADPFWRIGAAYTVLMLGLGWIVWEGFPGAAARVLLPLTLAFNVFAFRQRVAWAWLVLGNLTVVSGVQTLWEVPHDPRELAAVRASATACVATTGDGWYDGEQSSRHRWAWSSGRAVVELEAWPKSDGAVRFEFSPGSLETRTVTVRLGERELWRGVVGPHRRTESFVVPLTNGRATLEFTSDRPAVREPNAASDRPLAFALYDVRLVVTEP